MMGGPQGMMGGPQGMMGGPQGMMGVPQGNWGPIDETARIIFEKNKAELARIFQNGKIDELTNFLSTNNRNLILSDYNLAFEILSKPLGMTWLESEKGLKWLTSVMSTDDGHGWNFFLKYSTLLSSSPNPAAQKLANDLRVAFQDFHKKAMIKKGVESTFEVNYYQQLAQSELAKKAQEGKLPF
jgi:hypothetical protein